MERLYTVDREGHDLIGLDPIPLDDISERRLERLIKENPVFLGEELTIIGRQESFPEVGGDAIDLVALDKEGAVVIIEIKRGKTPSDVDFQALKYAAYVSTLSTDDLAQRAASFLRREENVRLREKLAALGFDVEESDLDLASVLYKQFGPDTDYDLETYEERLNSTQRIIILAENFDTRIGLVVTWLAKLGVDIKGLQYTQYQLGDRRLFQVVQVIPPPKLVWNIQRAAEKEWKRNPMTWHLERNCSPSTADRLQELISEIPEADVEWGQKLYIWIKGPARRLKIYTCYKSRFDLLFRKVDREAMEEQLQRHGAKPDIQESYTYDDGYDYVQIYPDKELKNSPLLAALRAFLLEQ